MTTLAEAAVDIVANTDGFEDELQQGVTQAGASADRTARTVGRDLGRSITAAAQKSLSAVGSTLQRSLAPVGASVTRLSRTLGSTLGRAPGIRQATNALGRFRDGFHDTQAAASAFSGYMGTLGGAARRALDPASHALGRFRDGFNNAQVAASAFSGRMGTLGGVAARAMEGARGAVQSAMAPLGRFRDGFNNAQVAASAFSGYMGTFGGVARRALDGATSAASTLREGLAGVRERIAAATESSDFFNSTLGRMGTLAAGVAAATGFAQLGSQILDTASSAQTTRESLLALYEAAGAGASEVNEVMAEMSTRFRGLDMTVMNEGITTLAYMGLQGEEAVDVLERLDMATTAAGTGATGLTRALDAMTKGVNAGKFMMGELGQISNAGIPIYDALSDVLGVSIPEAQAMASDGAIGLAEVLEALSGEAGVWFPALMEGAEGVSATFAGSWSTIQSSFVNGFAYELLPLLDRLAPGMANVADGVTQAFDRLPGLVDDVTGALSDSGAWDTFREVLDGVGQVMVSLRPLFDGLVSGLRTAGGNVLTLLGHLRPAGSALESLAGFLERNADLLRVLGAALGGAVTGLALYRGAALAANLASRLLAGGVRGIGAAIRGVPLIGWVLTAIGALVTLYQTSDRFRQIVDNAFARVKEAVQTAWAYIQPVWDTMVDRIQRVWDAVTGWEGWQVAWEGIQGAISTAWDVISGVWDSLVQGWENLSSALSGDGGPSRWGAVWDTVASSLETAWGVISTIFEQITEGWRLLTGLLTGDADFSDVGGFLLDTFGRLREVGSLIGSWLVDRLKELPGLALEALADLGSRVGGWFASLPGRVSDAVGGAAGLLSWLKDAGATALENLKGVGSTVVERIKAIPDMIKDNVDAGAILDWLKDAASNIGDFMSDYGPQILKGLGIAIGVVVLGVPALLLGLLAAILVVLGSIAWELMKWAWDAFSGMMSTAGQAIASGVAGVVGWFASLPGRALEAVTGFGARLASWGSGVMTSLRTALTNGMNALRSWWTSAWTGVFSTARGWWNNFVSWAGGAAGRLRDRVMTPVDKLKDRMIGAFDSARTGIREAWNGLRRAVGTPINWVIETAYTKGIKNIWDRVVGKFGGDKLPDAPAVLKFRAGGVFPGYTPGRDVHRVPMAAFSGGESILRPEVTRAWGAKTTLMLNKLARAGGVPAVRRALQMLFSGQNPFTGRSVPTSSGMNPGGGFAARFNRGGVMGSAGRAWSWLTSKTEDFAEGMMDFLDDPKGMFERMVNALVDWSSIPGSGLAVGKTLVGLPKKLLKELAQAIKDMFTLDGDTDWSKVGGSVGGRLGAALAFARAQAGKPYIWGGVGPRGYDCSGFTSAITNVILGRSPYSRRHTTHGFRGMTHDGFRRNFASPWMIGVTHAGVGHMSGTLMGTNVESRGSAGVVIGPRARGYNNGLYSWRGGLMAARSGSGGDRMGGEGIAFDSGGMLPRGWTLTYNGTRHPETVRTYAQERRVEDLVRLVESHHSRAAAPTLTRAGSGGAGAAPVLGHTTTVNAPITVQTLAADPETVAYKTAARIARLAGL